MKPLRSHIALPLICLTFFLSSCSKEISITKILSSDTGSWNVDEISWTKVETGSSISAKTGKETNAGTFVFNSDGTGSYDITIDGTLEHKDFNWNANNESVSITDTIQTNTEVLVYTIKESGPNRQKWVSSETIVNTSNVYNRELIIYMSK